MLMCAAALLPRSWEEERSSLTSQIEALLKEARLYVSSKSRGGRGGGADGSRSAGSGGADGESCCEEEDDLSPEAQLAAMKRALDEAKENEVGLGSRMQLTGCSFGPNLVLNHCCCAVNKASYILLCVVHQTPASATPAANSYPCIAYSRPPYIPYPSWYCYMLQVLLLEAYEQLEADVGQEVDRALAKQAEELARLNRRVQFLEGHLEAERKQVAVLSEEASKLEGQLADASSRNAQYESGVYGLPQVRVSQSPPMP